MTTRSRRKLARRIALPDSVPVFCLLLASALASPAAATPPEHATLSLPGLSAPVSVYTDREGVRHLVAANDLDLARAQGFVHARDRFFQMDATRRQASGDLAELLGPSVLPGDIENRTVGLRRAAERSAAALPAAERALLQAFADGVNAYLAGGVLPREYAVLELSQARPWDVVDSVVISKAIAASLSLDIDIGDFEQLQATIAAGQARGFDGEALFFQDLRRAAPMDPAATVPDATGSFPFLAKRTPIDGTLLARASGAARGVADRLRASPLLALALDRRDTQVGSNEWGIAARHSLTGKPLMANDPHLALDAPSTFYEIHLVVRADPAKGPMNVSGVTFAGTPGVILGQNERITWGATTNPMDVSDVFADTLIVDPVTTCASVGSVACIVSAGQIHPVDLQTNVSYRMNVFPDGVVDNVVPAPVPAENRVIATVPFRSFGPVLSVADPSVLVRGGSTTALVLQYTGFHATNELAAFSAWNRARNLADFRAGLAHFDVGSQNWAYADVDGRLAYFTSAELPLRADLEQGRVVGSPPFFVRDGSGPNNWVPDPTRSQGQAIPFAILPPDEMPHTIDPANGFFVNANNDPAGTTLDNDPLNQFRPGKPSALYYLNPGYADGLRAGRITRLIRDRITQGGKLTLEDMRRFQANTQQLDAELIVPHLLTAERNARRAGAPAELVALAQDPRIQQALRRLRRWDYSTPTGIAEGYDASDRNGVRGEPDPAEISASVAATIYNVFRAKLVRSVIDARLAALGVPAIGNRDALKAAFALLAARPFTGVGASGVDFFPAPAGASAEARRDVALLGALGSALDALASDAFADAFAGSTRQSDYRWGKLHRIKFDHPLGGLFSIPPAAGFEELATALPGLARDGGYEVVNASGFSSRADDAQAFRFGSGPVRRYVGAAGTPIPFLSGVIGFNVIAGGPSGDPLSPEYATQLPDWLTADGHFVTMPESLVRLTATRVEDLVPVP